MATVHADRHPLPGSPDTYRTTATACDAGSLTAAGWQRMYVATAQHALVTCKKYRTQHKEG